MTETALQASWWKSAGVRLEDGFMFARRSANPWRDAVSMMPARVLPGAHDLLAADATNNNPGARRMSSPLQTISTELAVRASDFHISKEQDHELCAY
jgi:hypothetical protein